MAVICRFPDTQFPSPVGQVASWIPGTWMGPNLASEFHLIAGSTAPERSGDGSVAHSSSAGPRQQVTRGPIPRERADNL